MNLPEPWFLSSVAARTAIVLFFLVVGIRIFGKRTMGDATILDIVLVLLLANAVQNAITYGSGRLPVGLVAAGTLLVIDRGIGTLFVRKTWLEARLHGNPVIIFANGRFDRGTMRREGVTVEEVLGAVRQYGLADLRQIRLAVLEPDGTISVVPKEHTA